MAHQPRPDATRSPPPRRRLRARDLAFSYARMTWRRPRREGKSMSASELAGLAEEEEQRKKRAPWGVIALVLLTGLALIRNGSGSSTSARRSPRRRPRRTAGCTAPPSAPPLPCPTPRPTGSPSLRSGSTHRCCRSAWTRTAGSARRRRRTRIWPAGSPARSPRREGHRGRRRPCRQQTGPRRVLRTRGPEEGKSRRDQAQGRKDGRLRDLRHRGLRKEQFPRRPCLRLQGDPELRVITCGGGFSKNNGYDGNVVAFARLVEVR